MVLHPIKAINELKHENKGSIGLSVIILVLYFVSQVFSYTETGYIFNYNRPERLSLPMVFATTVLPVLLWCVANWSICTLMDGEGKFSEIFISTSYSIMPLVVTTVPVALISKVLTLEEGPFLTIFSTFLTLWIAINLFVSSMVVHQYTFSKTVASMLLTVFGIAVILFLTVLLFSLFQQVYTFFATVTQEILFRID